ncbi:MAG: PEP-CTERM sorting domain-containing protein [Isosphaeraceae bacterium]
MTLLKTAAVTVLAWVALGPLAEAAPLSWFGSSNVSAWYASQAFANGGFYAPPQSPAPLLAGPSWYASPTYFSAILSAPQPTPTVAPPSTASAAPVDAYINMSSASFADSGNLTTGNPQPWYNSPAVVSAFGGTPTPDQQASFVQDVLGGVQQTFRNSGLDISLTTDPSVRADHMLSVVSGASYPGNPSAIGITTVGGNGFSFIDKLAYASTPDQLAWAVAHNVSHELVHALGVGSHPDTTGEYLDAATANWSMLTDPNAKFSPEAVELVKSAMGGSSLGSAVSLGLQQISPHSLSCSCQCCGAGVEGAQILEAPVPEPATIAMWSLTALGAMAILRRKSRRPAA